MSDSGDNSSDGSDTARKKRKRSATSPPLRRQRTFSGDTPFSTGIGFSRGTEWSHHQDSDDSDDYDSEPESPGKNRLYRALSEHEDPYNKGLKPAAPKSKRSLEDHVGGGGNSSHISLTSSKRKAVKWALKESQKNPPRVATIDLSEEAPVADLSDPTTLEKTKLGSTAKNFARSSSEVLHKGPIPASSVKRVETLKGVKKAKLGDKLVKTRMETGAKAHSKSKKKPRTFKRTTTPKPSSSKPGASRSFPKLE